MHLLATQVTQIYDLIDEVSKFDRRDFLIQGDPPILRLRSDPYGVWFSMDGSASGYNLEMQPGSTILRQRDVVLNWRHLLESLKAWLRNVEREQSAIERGIGSSAPAPNWVLKELPPEHARLVAEIEKLQEAERRLRRIAGLLWETGEALNKIVRDAFREIGFVADLTSPGKTFDVTVTLPEGRLLVEVTGIDGQIVKASKKITQVLDAHRHEAQAGDRVCLLVNAYRQTEPQERAELEIVSPEALRLLVGLDAVILSSVDLFKIWKASRSRKDEAAHDAVLKLRTTPPGMFALGSGLDLPSSAAT